MSWDVFSSLSSASLMPACESNFHRSGSMLLMSMPKWLTCLNPLGAPMSALDSLGPFFLFFLSFFPLLVRDKEIAGIKRLWISTVGP